MATLLYRLGRFSYRRSWTIIGVWLALLIGVLGGGFALGGQTQNSFAIPGTESQDALDQLEAVFPQVAGASATALVVAPDGASVTDDEYAEPIADLTAALGEVDGVDSAIGPFDEYAQAAVSDDESMARIQVQFDGQASDVSPASLDELTATRSIAEGTGLRVEFGGQVFQDNTVGITPTEVLGVLFAGVVLLITFGSLRAAGMPLLSALTGVGIVIGGIIGISAFTEVSSTAPLLALMIGLAVGIDYSLFILSRHRTQLAEGEDPEESAGISVGTAGSAVVFAGVTVIIALLGLLVVGIPFLSVMGIGAAFAVLVAIAVAVTLLPAILGLAKGRLAPKPGSRAHRRALAHSDAAAKPSFGLRWVRLVMRAPIVFTVAVVAVLATLAVPALSLDLNLPDGGSEPEGSTQRETYDLVSEGFGAGYNGPLVVAVDITQTVDVLGDLESIGDAIGRLDDVDFVSQGIPDPGLDTAIIQVTPESAPNEPATKALVQSIRDIAPDIEDEFDTPVSVTGATAVGIDMSNRLTNALVPFGLIVAGLSIILLMMVFRSILVPVKAALGFLLSVVAAFGVVVAIFQWGWLADLLNVENPGPILSFMPIILMAVLFGLAMDYEVFLVSGMREEFVKTGMPRRAVERGFASGARVVTAAALIMFFVFFAFVPEGSGTTIKPIALGLAVGIALDAFLVRMTLVPAVMTLLGRSAWWLPRWIGRILPNVDIEGEGLREHRNAVEWADTQRTAAISSSGLMIGRGATSLGPLDLRIPHGALVITTGDAARRRLLAATLSGRLEPIAGVAQVLGRPIPSESRAVSRIVALGELGGIRTTGSSISVGDLLSERIRLTQSVSRRTGVDRRVNNVIAHVSDVLVARGFDPVSRDSPTDALGWFERAVVLAAAAMAERTPVVILDLPDAAGSREDEAALLAAVGEMAPLDATVLIGTHAGGFAPSIGSRPIVHVDLDASVGVDPTVSDLVKGGSR